MMRRYDSRLPLCERCWVQHARQRYCWACRRSLKSEGRRNRRAGRTSAGSCQAPDPPAWSEHLEGLAERAAARLPLFPARPAHGD